MLEIREREEDGWKVIGEYRDGEFHGDDTLRFFRHFEGKDEEFIMEHIDGPELLAVKVDDESIRRQLDQVPTTVKPGDESFTTGDVDAIDKYLFDAHTKQIWPDDISKAPEMWSGDDGVPDFVKNWINTVVEQYDPFYGTYKGVSGDDAKEITEEIRKSLTQPQGWSINSIVNRVLNVDENLEKKQAIGIVRMEVAAVLNKSREVAYRAEKKVGNVYLFDWVGPDTESTTPICEAIKEEIDARGGAVRLDILEAIMREKANEYDDKGGTPHRVSELVPHYGCRHTLHKVGTQ